MAELSLPSKRLCIPNEIQYLVIALCLDGLVEEAIAPSPINPGYDTACRWRYRGDYRYALCLFHSTVIRRYECFHYRALDLQDTLMRFARVSRRWSAEALRWAKGSDKVVNKLVAPVVAERMQRQREDGDCWPVEWDPDAEDDYWNLLERANLTDCELGQLKRTLQRVGVIFGQETVLEETIWLRSQ